MDKQLIFCYFC